jgi:hypothetical protein
MIKYSNKSIQYIKRRSNWIVNSSIKKHKIFYMKKVKKTKLQKNQKKEF